MGTVQMVPEAFDVKPSAVQPVMVPTVYSCFPPCEAGTVMLLLMVSAAVVCRSRFCVELLPIVVAGKAKRPAFRMCEE